MNKRRPAIQDVLNKTKVNFNVIPLLTLLFVNVQDIMVQTLYYCTRIPLNRYPYYTRLHTLVFTDK